MKEHEVLFFEDEHKYLVDGNEVPSVTTILQPMSGLEYDKVAPAVLEQAARRGTLVHEYTALIDYDMLPDEIEFEVKGYLKAYADFRRDYRPDWDMSEDIVYSENYGYIGTVDRVGRIDGQRCVVDLKTISSPTKMQKFIVSSQTKAYQLAINETENAKDGDGVKKRYALYLGKDGAYNLVDLDEYDAKYDYEPLLTFLALKNMYEALQELKELKPIKKGKKK